MTNRYIRKGTYPIDLVLDKVVTPEKTVIEVQGVRVKTNSDRYLTFKEKGVRCAHCGIEGQFFALEKNPHEDNETHHFNLYALDGDNNEVLMTKDHIVAKANGGLNHLDNYQTMCWACNKRKGHK